MDLVSVLLAIIIIIVPSAFYLKSYLQWKKVADIVNKLPGPIYLPIFGTTLDLLFKSREEIFELFEERTAAYRPFFRTWMGSVPEVHITKPEHMEIIMSSSILIEKGHIYNFIKPWLGQGLLTSKGGLWHSRRKMITPAFHFKILDDFLDIFIEKGQKLADKLMKQNKKEYFDVYPYVNSCALDIICRTAMGVEINAMDNSNHEYVSAVLEMSELVMKRAFKPWLHNDFIFKKTQLGKQYYKTLSTLHNFTRKVIKENREMLKVKKLKSQISEEDLLLGKKQRLAFLDLLLEASKDGTVLTDTDIREEVDTFMFEGHDTTTVAICWSLFLLGNHPLIQEKVNDELYSIFHGEERPITMADLGDMKYLERVIKEALRLYPSVPFISRLVTKPVNIDNFEIPVGCTAVLQLYDVHRDPEHFPDPERFDPDRFLPEVCQKRHPFAYVPFSAGPRNCIGQKFAMMEEKAIIASILRKYKITSLRKQEEMKLYAELVLRPQEGIHIKIESRY